MKEQVMITILSVIITLGAIAIYMLFLLLHLSRIRNRKTILDFPEFRQTKDYDCGAMALSAVLTFYGFDIREDDIMKIARTDRDGTSIKNIVRTLNHFNLRCISKHMSINEVIKHIKNGFPVILPLQAWTERPEGDWTSNWSDGHYVVAIGFDRKRIYFEDPSSSLRTFLDFKELNSRWHDIDNVNKKFIHHGIAVIGDKKYNSNIAIHMD